MKKFYLICLLILFPVLLTAQVSLRDTVITWHTFDYELNDDNTVSWNSDAEYDTVTKTFSGYVLENEYLRVTLLPEFGGRILSMIYKPTGHEELYQNPAGTPYGVGEEWFYYKWLMVYGGIFPTLSEPEHGKAWLLPWDFEVLQETSDTIQCRMSWKDTVNIDGINTGKWVYGKTNLRCEFTVTLVKGISSLGTEIVVYNDSSSALNYEYWTCLTLAPGSEPGNPECTDGAELIIPTEKVKIPSWYPDIASQEEHISGESGIYTFTKLRYWKNWTNDGIAYAWDDEDKNYWGVINHDNEEGIIRVSDNSITKGIKMWAWGYEQSQDIDPFKDPSETHRPYVELWAGHSNEFFEPAEIDANSMKKWNEVYFPTVGLSGVTHSDSGFVADINIADDHKVNIDFMTSFPGNEVNVSAEITGQYSQVLSDENVSVDPSAGGHVVIELPDQTFSEDDSLKCVISDTVNGNSLTAVISLDGIISGVADNTIQNDFQLYQNYPNPFNPATSIKFSIAERGITTLTVYSVTGERVAELVNKELSAGNYEVVFNASKLSSGVYFYQLRSNNFVQTKKLVLLK